MCCLVLIFLFLFLVTCSDLLFFSSADASPRVGPNDAPGGRGFHGALLVQPRRHRAGGMHRAALPNPHSAGDVPEGGRRARGDSGVGGSREGKNKRRRANTVCGLIARRKRPMGRGTGA